MNEFQQPDDGDRGDLSALLAILGRRWWIIVLAIVVTAGAAYGFSKLQDTEYTATGALLTRQLLLDVQVSGQPLELSGDAAREADTTARLLAQDDVLRATAIRLGPPYTPKAVDDATDIKPKGQSNVVEVSATSSSPREAARIANALMASFIATRRGIVDAQLTQAIRGVRRQIAAMPESARLQRRLLRSNVTKLELLRNVETGDAQIADRADVPTQPSSPKTFRNVVIGACLGLLIGLALALLAELADRRLRKPEDLERALGLSLLTSVPRSRALKGAQFDGAVGPGELEAFRRLRANLRYRDTENEVESLLVTSAGSGSGKTTVAVYLAASAASAKLRVLLIEADLRRPRLADMLDIPPGHDLGRALEPGGVNGGFYEVEIERADGENSSAPTSFEVLPAGEPRTDASELLDSDAMRRLVSDATEAFDLVIIDGPPPSLISDAIPLMKQVNGVVVVARMGRESREDVEELRTSLELLDIRTLGAVATFSRSTSNVYLPSS